MKRVERFLFPRLSPPGDRWRDVLGFVPAVSVSSSSTLQIFRDASHSWWLLCPHVYLLGRFEEEKTDTTLFSSKETTSSSTISHRRCRTNSYRLYFPAHCSSLLECSSSNRDEQTTDHHLDTILTPPPSHHFHTSILRLYSHHQSIVTPFSHCHPHTVFTLLC